MSDEAKDTTAKNQTDEKQDAILWSKDKNAKIKRVFRAVKPRKTRAKKIITLMRYDHMENGTSIKGCCIGLKPNPAYQYVLNAGAIDYDKQLSVLRSFEGKGEIVEIDPKNEGIPFVSAEEKRLAEVERERAKLIESIGGAPVNG